MNNVIIIANAQDSRKWHRRVLLLCLLILLFIGLLVFFLPGPGQRHGAPSEQDIRAARELLQSDAQVRRAFGDPVLVGERPKKVGDDDLTFLVTGPTGLGEADVQVRPTKDGAQPNVVGVRVNKRGGSAPAPKRNPEGDGETPATSGDTGRPDSATSDNKTGTVNFGETFDFDTIQFAGGKYSKVIEAVEKVVGPGRVRASTRFPPGGPAWTCVLVEGSERVCLMDPAWTLDDFPVLQEHGFQPVQGPATKTLSIYSAVTASTMNYKAAKGDRVVVLVCPRSEWEVLKVPWPKQQP